MPLAQAEKVMLSGPFQVRLGEAAQYSASVWNATIPPVVWLVNGAAGGTSSTGLISASDLYSPASTFTAGSTVTSRSVLEQGAVFADNGSGVRGDMRAVLTAILKDPEARAADTDATAVGGHLREPILYFAGNLRALEFTNVDPQGRYDKASSYPAPPGQVPYAASSVFNFFPLNDVMPGTAVNAPEFAQEKSLQD
jgi:hypothetical protein